MAPDFLSVGCIARDIVDGRERPGGSVLYTAKAAQAQGASAAIATSAGEDFPPAETTAGIPVWRCGRSATTTFEFHYAKEGGSRLSERCIALAEPIDIAGIPAEWRKSRAVLVCPVWNEVAPEAFIHFETPHIAVTPQGWFRDKGEDGRFLSIPCRYRRFPKKAGLLVVSADDLSGDPEAWGWMSRQAEVAVKTMGKKGYILAAGGKEKMFAPPFVAGEIDPTGAGDVFAATMLIRLSEGVAPEAAARAASVAASFAVETVGMEHLPTRAQIEQRGGALGQR